jgi:hypothetical protein
MRDANVIPAWKPYGYADPTEPFTLDIDTEIYLRWGEKPKQKELLSAGLTTELAAQYGKPDE